MVLCGKILLNVKLAATPVHKDFHYHGRQWRVVVSHDDQAVVPETMPEMVMVKSKPRTTRVILVVKLQRVLQEEEDDARWVLLLSTQLILVSQRR